MKIPPNNLWKQPNLSDIFGSVFESVNMNFDEPGYAKLSPRTVLLLSEKDDENLGLPLAFGRHSSGDFFLVSSDAPYEIDLAPTDISIQEDNGSGNPVLSLVSHGKWWQNRWYVSTATAIKYRTVASDTWTDISVSLTSGVQHFLEVFKNLNYLAVANGNTVRLYNSSHSLVVTLTLPVDFEVVGMAYNNSKLGIITRLGDDTSGQNGNAFFFTWDGSTTEAGQGISTGSFAGQAMCDFLSTYLVNTKDGRIRYWNGGGFGQDDIANFPFYNETKHLASPLSLTAYGDSMLNEAGLALVNASMNMADLNRVGEQQSPNSPSGVWCMDLKVGFYHRYSPSISPVNTVSVAAVNVDVSTNIITKTTGTVPPTGSPARYTSSGGGTAIGGLKVNQDYYVIKLSDTTFRLAETKDLALAGTAIDLTAQSDQVNYFMMVQIRDFGQTYFNRTGAIGTFFDTSQIYEDILIGASTMDPETLDGYSTLSMGIPFLENRGHIVFSRVIAEGKEDIGKALTVRFRPLKDDDAIVVKHKPKDLPQFPISAPQAVTGSEAVWTGTKNFYTSTDLSPAVDYMADSHDNQLEIFFTSGVGAGQAVAIESITYDETLNRYAVELEEDVVGAEATLQSYFIVDNWHFLKLITADSVSGGDASVRENDQGYAEVEVSHNSKRQIFKLELRGYRVAVEMADLASEPYAFSE